MRKMLALAAAALAAACVADAPEAAPSGPGPERWAEFAARHPNILLASPEATNYAPPGWPFEPGQEITEDDLRDVGARGQWEGSAQPGATGYRWQARKTPRIYARRLVAHPVVWVVSGSGPEGAMPFGPWVDYAGEDKFRYYGHLPVYHSRVNMLACCFGTDDVPAPLRGIVDPEDHAFDLGSFRFVKHRGVSHTNPRPGYHPSLFARDAFRGICDDIDIGWDGQSGEEYGQCAQKYLAHARAVHYGPEASW